MIRALRQLNEAARRAFARLAGLTINRAKTILGRCPFPVKLEPIRCACGCGHAIEWDDHWVKFRPEGGDPSLAWLWLFDHLNRRRGGTLVQPDPVEQTAPGEKSDRLAIN